MFYSDFIFQFHSISFRNFCGSKVQPGIESPDKLSLSNFEEPTFQLAPGSIITAVYVLSDPHPTVFLGTSDGFMIKVMQFIFLISYTFMGIWDINVPI